MVTETTAHPTEILAALLKKGNRRDKEEKLRKLNNLCEKEFNRHSQGTRDLSLSNMSKIAESHGLFKARTIYNAQSKDYAELITAWEAYNGQKQSKQTKDQKKSSEKYAFLKKIDDPAIRTLCLLAFAERDKIKSELNLLKSKTQVIVDMRPLGAGYVPGKPDIAIIETAAQLTDSERTALLSAIDKNMLAQRKWKLGADGEILDERGRFVFMPGFVFAITKILRIPITFIT